MSGWWVKFKGAPGKLPFYYVAQVLVDNMYDTLGACLICAISRCFIVAALYCGFGISDSGSAVAILCGLFIYFLYSK